MSTEPTESPRRLGLIARIIDLSGRHRFMVFIAAAVLTGWGLVSAQR